MRPVQVLGGFSDEEFVTGDEESRRRAREEHRRQQRLHLAESSTWKRIDLADLRLGRIVEDTRTDERYRVYRGEVFDAVNLPVVAWYIRNGEAVFLEPSR